MGEMFASRLGLGHPTIRAMETDDTRVLIALLAVERRIRRRIP